MPKTPAEAIQYLSQLSPSAIRLGLDRIHEALAALKHPEAGWPALHVAGTNGKGSTCAFAANVLSEQGYVVGLYTSPHLVKVNERIQIDGEPISDELFGRRILEVLDQLPEGLDLSYFELGTVVAFWHFAQEKIDVAVLEAGLGGRLDAVTACKPLVTAITQIGFDHMEYLGHTLAAIAGEKAGIIKANVPLVVGRQPPEALEVLERTARQLGAPMRLLDREFSMQPVGSGFVFRGARGTVPGLELGLRGPHQADNAAVALASLELLAERGLTTSEPNIRKGLREARWPGRLEELPGTPPIVLDGAHNPMGVEALVRALDSVYPGRPIHLVFGVLSDKDHRPMIRALFPRCTTVHLTPLPSPRSLDPAKYLEDALKLGPKVTAHDSPAQALAAARAAATAPNALVLGAGSLFLIGELTRLCQWLREEGHE
ncbi:MAG: folylpolyglutamate synthase/dihydrofolate synthase family protein [Myxococcaceae bacterium]